MKVMAKDKYIAYIDYKITAIFDIRGISADTREEAEKLIKEEIRKTLIIDRFEFSDWDIDVWFKNARATADGKFKAERALVIIGRESMNRIPMYIRF